MQKIQNSQISKNNDADTCFHKIIQLIKYKDRCSFELYNKLVINGNFNNEDFRKALEKAKNCYLIDDLKYAQNYIESSLCSNKGSYVIIKHLDDMHIDYKSDNQLNILINNAKNNDYCRAMNYIKKYKTSSKNPRRAYISSLIRKGYSFECAKTVVNNLSND